MAVTTGLQLPFGIQPVNPVPVDSWSGPFTGPLNTVQSAVDTANAAIPSAIRFQSMEVRLIIDGVSRKFWYRDGVADADLVEFASGGSTSPGGNSTNVQFNDGGSFGGNANFLFDKTSSTLSVTNLSGSLTRLTNGTSYLVAGNNITIATGSSGQVTISSTVPAVLPIAQTSWMETPIEEADGVNMIFTLQNSPTPANSLMFFINGVLQKPGMGYDYMLSGSTIAMLNAPGIGSNVTATYTYQTAPEPGANTSWMETPVGDIDGANVVYTLQNTPYPISALMFYVNGILQIQGVNYDFLASDNIVILSAAPEAGSNVTATYPY